MLQFDLTIHWRLWMEVHNIGNEGSDVKPSPKKMQITTATNNEKEEKQENGKIYP